MDTSLANSTRLLLVAGALGAVTFVGVWLVDGATRPGYSSVRHPVSALALGGRGWVQVANFVVTGALMAAFALGVRRALGDGPAATWVPLLLAVFALGLIASGLFAMDPLPDYPPDRAGVGTTSWHGVAHDIAGLVVFAALPAAALVFGGRFWAIADLRWLGLASVAAGVVSAGLFVAYAVAGESGRAGAGLLQRASIVVGWGWIALVAVTLLTTAPKAPR